MMNYRECGSHLGRVSSQRAVTRAQGEAVWDQTCSSCSPHQAESTWREQGGCSTPPCASAVRVFQGMPLALCLLCHHVLGTLQLPDTRPAQGPAGPAPCDLPALSCPCCSGPASLALLWVISLP